MSESNSEFVNKPMPNDQDITGQAQESACHEELTRPLIRKHQSILKHSPETLLSRLVTGLILGVVLLLAIGILLPFLQKTRGQDALGYSKNNLRQMSTGMLNAASNMVTGNLPPAYGEYPPAAGNSASFFQHLLPYIEQGNLAEQVRLTGKPSNVPVKTYMAPCDPRNRGTDSTISYCTNATLLSGAPRYPASFNGRAASLICIMERSGMDGAHKWGNQNNSLGTSGAPPPFPQFGIPPALYLDAFPQGFSSQGCFVALGDGSVRTITKAQLYAWNWACNPADQSPILTDW